MGIHFSVLYDVLTEFSSAFKVVGLLDVFLVLIAQHILTSRLESFLHRLRSAIDEVPYSLCNQ
jgi:hypothetical protein